MLDAKIAQKVVDKISSTMNYAINIIDIDGIIIADKDKTLIGCFHEVAHRMISQKVEMELVSGSNAYENVSAGMYLLLSYAGQILGVLGITGEPEEIISMSNIVKLSAETMIEYELFKERIRLRSNKKDLLINMLLYQDYAVEEDLRSISEGLGINGELARVAILIHFFNMEGAVSGDAILRTIAENFLHSHQDIMAMTQGNDCVIFKSIAKNLRQSIAQFKETIIMYCKNAANLLEKKCGLFNAHFYVGSLQNSIEQYTLSFQHAQWLKNYTELGGACKDTIVFFSDQLTPYMQSQVSPFIYRSVFEVYAASISEDEKKQFVEIGEALYKSEMNLTLCAKQLYIHRNTLTSRMNKLKQYLGMDPINNMGDQQFFLYLLHYLKNDRNGHR